MSTQSYYALYMGTYFVGAFASIDSADSYVEQYELYPYTISLVTYENDPCVNSDDVEF